MKINRDSLVLYTTAICNLNCEYCYIDKSPALQKIDDLLDESFKGDYYFNFSKELFYKDKLKSIQFWGGEPSIRLDRAYDTVDKCIQFYPNVFTFMTSTNFVYEKWDEQTYGLFKVFEKYPDRKFEFNQQLSLDGPEYINDAGRGKGTTERFKKAFDKMNYSIDDALPRNVHFQWFFKPTLDKNTILQLQTKDKIIEYYQFFEEFYKKFKSINHTKSIGFHPSVPNTACPSPHTKEDGIAFANLCRLCREIEKENSNKHYFEFYKEITPFSPRRDRKKGYEQVGFTCGTGRSVIGLLPNRMVSMCHNGFCDLISDYKENALKNPNTLNSALDFTKFFQSSSRPSKMTLTLDQFAEYEREQEFFWTEGTKARLANEALLINGLARAGQVDEQYKNREKAAEAARFMQNCAAYCQRDNYNTTGSLALPHVGLIKLLLNGAKEYCEDIPR